MLLTPGGDLGVTSNVTWLGAFGRDKLLGIEGPVTYLRVLSEIRAAELVSA